MIKRIDAYPLIAEEPHYRGARRCVTLVRAESDDGAVGWGEAISQFPEAALASKTLIDEGFAPRIVGRDAVDVERLWSEMCSYAYWFGVEGIAAFAISAIDMALWDLKGKLLGQPVAKLLGGRLKDELPAMASIIFDMDDLDWTLNEFRGFVDAGYRIAKAGWGMAPDSMFGEDREKDIRYVRAVREAVGPEMSLVVDVPGARGLWDVPTAIRRFRELEEFELRWIEQPLPPADLAGHRRLRAAVATPIGTGEDEWSPETYGRVIESEGVDVLQLDPGRCLGLTGCRRVIAMAETAGLKCSAHTWSSALNTAASLHFLATSKAGDTLDLKPHQNPLQHELVEDPWEQKDGMLALRNAPGLGVTVREDVVAKYSFSK
ncbi:MAG: mandelate racemase/muconate lactonizing enzyme family protein [Actinobacteria bacterium]|nr:mandelate racemase/muconate lactonizing enzyme family protein [Actinomycetota bacterium]